MGQKVNPKSQRLLINETWKSRWFDSQHYAENLISDLRIRQALQVRLKTAAVSRVDISRDANKLIVDIYSGRPGLIIGRKGTGTDELKKLLSKLVDSKIQINIVEVKNPDGDACVVAQNIATQIERRMPYKRVIKQALEKAKEVGVKGIKVQVSGRLNGAEIARQEKVIFGTVPLSTFKSHIDYSYVTALTTYGIIGVKVWVYKGERGMDDVALADRK
ncbi:MAG: 30S ribosomal protein S3 [Patescibacteria group bacterium]|jgi:small subunit ribosomal protein S3